MPELANEEALARARLKAIRLRLARRSADAKDLEDNLVIEQERAALASRLQGLAGERRQLEVRAPIAGRVVELMSDLHPDRWLAAKEPIALIDGSPYAKVAGYISVNDVWRVVPGAKGRFMPEDPQAAAVGVTLTSVAVSGASEIDILELASPHGGAIDAEPDQHRKLLPSSAQYRATLDVIDGEPAPDKMERGTVVLTGKAESLIARAWRRVLTVLVRESGA